MSRTCEDCGEREARYGLRSGRTARCPRCRSEVKRDALGRLVARSRRR